MVNKIIDDYECPCDILLLKFIDTHLDIYQNIEPNTITTVGIIFAIVAAYNISIKNYKIAALIFLCSYYFDCVDGKVARKYNKVTVFGDYYDHIGDVFKILIILYALYKSNTKNFNKISYLLIILLFFMMIHFACQEKIYNQDTSPSLQIFRDIIPIENPTNIIIYTRFFGNGTLILVLSIIIFLWK